MYSWKKTRVRKHFITFISVYYENMTTSACDNHFVRLFGLIKQISYKPDNIPISLDRTVAAVTKTICLIRRILYLMKTLKTYLNKMTSIRYGYNVNE